MNPNPDNNFHEAKAWVESLTVAGGGWRLPTMAELKAIYQKDASAYQHGPAISGQGGLGLVRGVEKRLVGLGLSLLQQLAGLAQHELR